MCPHPPSFFWACFLHVPNPGVSLLPVEFPLAVLLRVPGMAAALGLVCHLLCSPLQAAAGAGIGRAGG